MSSFSPILSIIVVSYNTADLTLDCLSSILLDKGLKSTPFEMIIVDNNSTDDSPTLIKKFFTKKKFPHYQLVLNRENLGFGRANNQGVKAALGNYLLFLNSDTIIHHSAISQSLDWLSSHPESYGCTAQLLNSDKTIQPSGGYFPNLGNTFTWLTHLDDLPLVNLATPPYHPHPPQFYLHSSFYLHDHPQDWVTGAFMMLRKNVFDAVGGFDDQYFMYGEEVELCYRIHQQFPQLSLWYLIGPQVTHLGGASATHKIQILTREYEGIMAFFIKHRHPLTLPLIKLLIGVNRYLNCLL